MMAIKTVRLLSILFTFLILYIVLNVKSGFSSAYRESDLATYRPFHTFDEETKRDAPQTTMSRIKEYDDTGFSLFRTYKRTEILSFDGYLDIGDISTKLKAFNRRCIVVKMVSNKSRKDVNAILTFFMLFACATGTPKQVIYYMLVISGVELNPGPGNERKRFRKSGVRYKTYLTNRESFENAPTSLQSEVRNFQENERRQGHTEELSIDEEQSTSFEPDVIETSYVESDTDMSSSCDDETESEFEEEHVSDNEPQYFTNEDAKQLPIYDGSQITLGASILLIMTFILNYNLTSEAFSDLLELIQLHCKESNLLPTTTFVLKKWFQELKIAPEKHYYCSKCLIPVNVDSVLCPNTKCNFRFSGKNDKSFFVEVSLIEQLKKLFTEKEFRNQINDVDARQAQKTNENIEEMYDGSFYKECRRKKQMSIDDITFTWNTDGVPLFKSSKTSMWPLFLCINELPYKVRSNPENLLLVGLWIGPKKPEMLTFLSPFIEQLDKLEKGIDVPLSDEQCGRTLRLRGFLISGTADLPAKCTVHNMIQFNGKFSCPYCTQPGETATAGKGVAHIFPFKFDGPISPQRNHEDSLEYAEKAVNQGKPEWGIKGPCWFTQLTSYDFVRSNCIDYMHCVLLGIMKRLITLWFSKENAGKPFSFYNKLDNVNKRLTDLRPPLFITRVPRQITDLKYWKASEFKSFLLYYGPVILVDILDGSYYSHFLLLSEAVFLLLKQSIKPEELERAENLLEHFHISFPHLYEKRYLTLNFHLLLHLPENVRQLGPIWGYSCFPFENANGFLMKLIKGTQSVHAQLIDTISIIHGLPFLEKHCIEQGTKACQLMKSMKRNHLKRIHEISQNIFAVGKLTEMPTNMISADCSSAIASTLGSTPVGKIFIFKRLHLNGRIYHSRDYTRVRVRNSFTVSYRDSSDMSCHGVVHYYILYQPADITKRACCLAILTQLRNLQSVFPTDEATGISQMQHMGIFHSPNFQEAKIAIRVEQINKLCVYMQVNRGYVYVCDPPNSVEME